MKKGKGISFEEKRKRMLEIFKDDPSFFHFKDIEKLGMKKGIIFQAIKDVLESLVADNLVETDKIGSSNFYWSLPSKIYQVKKNTLEKNSNIIMQLKQDNENLQQKIKDCKALRKETKERQEKLDELDSLLRKKEEYTAKINEFQKNDPERHQNLLSDAKQFVNLSEHWKENIVCIAQWLKSKNPDANLVEMFPELEPLKLFD